MYEFGMETFIVATRKIHHCEWCGETICLGFNAIKRDYRFDGCFVHAWQHTACHDAMKTMSPDEFEQGEFKHGSTERRDW